MAWDLEGRDQLSIQLIFADWDGDEERDEVKIVVDENDDEQDDEKLVKKRAWNGAAVKILGVRDRLDAATSDAEMAVGVRCRICGLLICYWRNKKVRRHRHQPDDVVVMVADMWVHLLSLQHC